MGFVNKKINIQANISLDFDSIREYNSIRIKYSLLGE